MKTLWIVPLFAGAMLVAAPMMSTAQDNPKPAAKSQATDPDAARNQPFMATGLDLKGPPRQFPADQTPE